MNPYRMPSERQAIDIYIEPAPRRRRAPHLLLTAGMGLIVARIAVGCFPADIAKDTAAGLYEAQQLACVDKYADKPSIDKCRARVKASWAVDAGREGGDQ